MAGQRPTCGGGGGLAEKDAKTECTANKGENNYSSQIITVIVMISDSIVYYSRALVDLTFLKAKFIVR